MIVLLRKNSILKLATRNLRNYYYIVLNLKISFLAYNTCLNSSLKMSGLQFVNSTKEESVN